MSSPEVAVSGSIAYDHIMAFGGSFGDHIIPEKTHVISLSFLVDSLKKQRGGVAGNVSYSLALLGSSSWLIGAVGSDFGPYAELLEELGIDLTHVLRFEDQLTASAFMMADLKDNHIASFYPGPGNVATAIDARPIGERCRFAMVGATSPDVMEQHAAEFGRSAARLIYDPAFQIIIVDAGASAPRHRVRLVHCEQRLRVRDDRAQDRFVCSRHCRAGELVVVTYGEAGSELIAHGRIVRVPSAPVTKVVDPTGAGDAFRSGLIKGLLLDLDLEIVGTHGRSGGGLRRRAYWHAGALLHDRGVRRSLRPLVSRLCGRDISRHAEAGAAACPIVVIEIHLRLV